LFFLYKNVSKADWQIINNR